MKVAIVTGASRGIGFEIVTTLLAKGYRVIAIVASGFEGGGHRGSFLRRAEEVLMGGISLIPQVVDAVSVPVIAAGGIADGRGVVAALALGAQGVQIGTAFLRCSGSGASKAHQDALNSDSARWTGLTDAFTGRLARGIRNHLMDDLAHQNSPPLPFPLQHMVTQTVGSAASVQQKVELMTLWAGQSASLSQSHEASELSDEPLGSSRQSVVEADQPSRQTFESLREEEISMNKVPGAMPAYTYGEAAVATSRVSLEELEQLKVSVGLTADDERYLRKAGAVLEGQTKQIVAHWRSGIIAGIPNLARHSRTLEGEPIPKYLAQSNLRFEQWILDTCLRPYDQDWLNYQQEIALRHTSLKKNRVDGVESTPYVPFRDIAAFVAVLNDTIKPYLASAGNSASEVEAMHRAWCRSLQLQIALWARVYVDLAKTKSEW